MNAEDYIMGMRKAELRHAGELLRMQGVRSDHLDTIAYCNGLSEADASYVSAGWREAAERTSPLLPLIRKAPIFEEYRDVWGRHRLRRTG